MRDPLTGSAKHHGLGYRGPYATRPSRARVVAGAILFLALAVLSSGANANAASIWQMLFPTTTQPAPPPTTTTTTTTTQVTGTTTPAGDSSLTLRDTGLTRIRATVESQAAWTSFSLDGTDIMAAKLVSTSGNAKSTSMAPSFGISGTGTAVYDLILRIASSAQPVLTTCKNYQGPATFTLLRRTDAPTTVLKYTNKSTSFASSKTSCEGRSQVNVARGALIGPVRWPARVDSRPLVLAQYVPWWDANNVQWSYGSDMNIPQGPANTDDPATVAAAVDLASRSGVDGFVIEYSGAPDGARRIGYVLDAADARHDFQTALQLDLAILAYDNGGQPSPAALDAALDQVASVANHPSQLRVQGQPVVFVYGQPGNITPQAWQDALARAAARTGLTPYVVAQFDNLGSPGRYQYGTYGIRDRAGLDSWAADMLNRFRIQPALADQPAPLWATTVGPGFDDRALHRSTSMYIDRAGGQRYEDEWAASLTSLPDWVVITTWNEYWEQTHIGPDSATGTRALDQTTPHAASFHTTG